LSTKVVVIGGHLTEFIAFRTQWGVPYEKSVFKKIHVLNFRNILHFVFFTLSVAVNINV